MKNRVVRSLLLIFDDDGDHDWLEACEHTGRRRDVARGGVNVRKSQLDEERWNGEESSGHDATPRAMPPPAHVDGHRMSSITKTVSHSIWCDPRPRRGGSLRPN